MLEKEQIPFKPEMGARQYVFRLYVAGLTPRSQLAISRARSIFEEYLVGRYDLEIIDIYQQPRLAKEAQIVAVPTLIKHSPGPSRRFIGDLEEREKVVFGLGLKSGVDPYA